MSKKNYLEIVDNVVRYLNGDNNPEIIYTLEQTRQSSDVTKIVEDTYYKIINGKEWKHLDNMFQLVATGASTPTHMTFPSAVIELEYVKYNVRTTTDTKDIFKDMTRLLPDDFMAILDARDNSLSTVDAITDTSGITLNIVNDTAPQYYTSFDNDTLIFDAYDSVVDTVNLTAAKTQCYGKLFPTVTVDDTFIFDMPIEMYSYFMNEVKAAAFAHFNRDIDRKMEDIVLKQRIRVNAESSRLNQDILYPNYGRKGKK